MTVTREDLVKTLGLDAKDAKTDRAVYGEVMSINEDQTYQVSLNGSDTTVKCARLSGAKVGDTVLVEILANGYSVVTGTVGGDTDASDAQASAAAAVTAAGQAQSAAGQASTAASQALTKANEAEASASAASTAAAAAQTAADTADSKATAAGTAAAAAQSSADAAASAAATADSKADAASAAATRAETKADTASAAASRAETAAGNAETAAASAQTSADGALVGLSTVQDVVGVLNWITAHGTMTSQSGGTFDENQVYFIQDNNGDYTVGGVRYSLVAEPKAADIDTYYVLALDESVQNYVATHLAVDTEGLWIIPDAGGNKVLIATGNGSTYTTAGTYIVNGSTVLARFLSTGIELGDVDNLYITLNNNGLIFGNASNYLSFLCANLYNTKIVSKKTNSLGSAEAGIEFYSWMSSQDASNKSAWVHIYGNGSSFRVANREITMTVGGYDIARFTYDDTNRHRTSLFYDDHGNGVDFADKLTGSAGASGSTGITLGDWKVCWGSVSMNTNTASGSGTFTAPYYVDQSITLDFSAVPYVWAQCQGSLTGTNYVLVTSTSKTSATLRLMSSHKNTNTRNVRWFAIGQA